FHVLRRHAHPVHDRVGATIEQPLTCFGPPHLRTNRTSANPLRTHRQRKLRRRVGPTHVAHLRFVTSVDSTSARNAVPPICRCQSGNADRRMALGVSVSRAVPTRREPCGFACHLQLIPPPRADRLTACPTCPASSVPPRPGIARC